MPHNTREKLLAWRETLKFKKSNYAHVKAWRARPENKAKRAEEARRWREKHPEIWNEIKQRHRANNIERIRAREAEQARAKRKADPEGNRRRIAAFKARKRAKEEQIAGRPCPELCELCSEFNRRIVFDHCHAKGHFRGWLCDRCNKVLGLMKDDATLLRKMAEYLDGSSESR